jgi:flagellar basal-body rod protein FlgB
MFQASPIPVLEQLVQFAQARHEVLAGNVANIDTPGYRTRDLPVADFQSRMKQALASRSRSEAPALSLTGSPQAPAVDPVAQVSSGLASILKHDDSNVGIEQQVAELTKNQMQHNLAMSILGSQYRLMAAAISERA